ncbi:MAG: hypothetical protein U5J96_20135 [Ignavibacteriaceae bacterium]|nr:hypothetical protein [Ignavibacteriaceae bacterium]
MITQPIDTNPEVERVLISLLRKLNTTQKFEQVISFSSSIIKLSKRAIHRANPDLSEDERKLLFVEYHYGTVLADKLRSFLNQNKLLNEIRN